MFFADASFMEKTWPTNKSTRLAWNMFLRMLHLWKKLDLPISPVGWHENCFLLMLHLWRKKTWLTNLFSSCPQCTPGRRVLACSEPRIKSSCPQCTLVWRVLAPSVPWAEEFLPAVYLGYRVLAPDWRLLACSVPRTEELLPAVYPGLKSSCLQCT